MTIVQRNQSLQSEPSATLDPANWDDIRAQGHRMLDDMFDYAANIRERPVWSPIPNEVRARFRSQLPREPTDLGEVYRVNDYPGRRLRKTLYSQLDANRYTVVGIICSAEPIMTKWKWALAARLPGKVFVLNENGDYFWLDRGHLSNIRHFVLFRAGLTGSGAVRTLARLVLFPFTLLYLIVYAGTVHLRRKLRTL